MTDKPFLTIKEQYELLSKDRGLKFINKESAMLSLKRYGYYEIINGYKTYFLNDPSDDNLGYKEDANFEHIFDLFTLDKRIRESVLESLEEFEQTFKQALAYVISEKISDNQNNYVAKSHYNAGKSHYNKRKQKYTDRDNLLRKMNKLLKSSFEPFNHYRNEHNNIPPWILVKGLSFGEAIYWFELSKRDIRINVVSRMINMEPELIKLSDKSLGIMQSFSDLLLLYLDYRNISAHGGRTFSHRSQKHAIRHYSSFLYRKGLLDTSKTKFSSGKFRSSVGVVILSLQIFSNRDPYQTMSSWIEVYVLRYLKNYPTDLTLLCKEMEFFGTSIETDIRNELIKNDSQN